MALSSTPTKLSKVKIMHAEAAHKQKEMEEAILMAEVEEAEERHWKEEEQQAQELEHQKHEKQKATEAAKKVAAKKARESAKGKGKAKNVEDGEPELKKKSKRIVETDEEGDGPEMPPKKKVKAEGSGGSMMDVAVLCLWYVCIFLKLFKLLTSFQMQDQ